MKSDKSMGSLFRELAEELSTLVRSEVALAKIELKQTAAGLGTVGALFAASVFLILCGAAFLLVTAILALALVISAWLATLVVAAATFAGAAGLFIAGRKKMRTIEVVPTRAVESVKTDIQSISNDISRFKRGPDEY